jgi:predicted RNase H-like HicB family nuclease
MNYIGLIHKDKNSDYGVSFPDFPGVITAGADLDDARTMAEEALALHIEGMLEDGESIPAPSSLEEIMVDPTNHGAVVIVVAAASAGAVRRVNVTFPEDVLAQIDAYARQHGLSRSGFLAQAAKKILGIGQPTNGRPASGANSTARRSS